MLGPSYLPVAGGKMPEIKVGCHRPHMLDFPVGDYRSGGSVRHQGPSADVNAHRHGPFS